jgi:hypothetical protein
MCAMMTKGFLGGHFKGEKKEDDILWGLFHLIYVLLYLVMCVKRDTRRKKKEKKRDHRQTSVGVFKYHEKGRLTKRRIPLCMIYFIICSV